MVSSIKDVQIYIKNVKDDIVKSKQDRLVKVLLEYPILTNEAIK